LSRHEHFEELAAVAAKGELTLAEQQELAAHLATCPACREVYEEYEQLHAPFRPPADPGTELRMEAVLESSREKVRAAVLQTIGTSRREAPLVRPLPAFDESWNPLRVVWASLGFATAMACMFWLGTRYEQRVVTASGQALSVKSTRPPVQVDPVSVSSNTQDERTAAEYADLLKEFQGEKQRDGRLDAALTDKERELADIAAARQSLEQQLESTSQDLQSTKALLAAKTGELAQMQATKASDATSLVALEYQVADLTQKLGDQTQALDRERQLLANGRDIRDIIGARNLHILDVYDTDSQGNTRKSFARAFYTEGKSLVFYAYDLPTRGTDEGKFVYTAWGESNGNKSRVQKLGILLNDDKGQKRWALNFSDPKVLAEIDSVFVTLERVDTDDEQPKGKRMLTAYLDSQVNHP
jgi:hypothetical protein